ncbi:MAG: hypothetical protein KC656_27740, partial [Myxococcales bacterium]|nr:hypothetical protein [Myxococcales bacterium]
MTHARHPGHGPWDEVWFVEGVDASGAGFWVRVAIEQGAHGPGRLACWAIWDGDDVVASWSEVPLAPRAPGTDPQVHQGDVEVSGGKRVRRHRGRTPRIAWDLTVAPRGPAPDVVPRLLETLGVGRTYASEAPCAGIAGTI